MRLRRTLQGRFGPFAVLQNAYTIVPLGATLDTPDEGTEWEIGLVTARLTFPQTVTDNRILVSNASLTPTTADVRISLHSNGFYYVEANIGQQYTGTDFRMVENLSSPIVVSPSETLQLDLTIFSHPSSPGNVDAIALTQVQGYYNVLLAGDLVET